MVAKGLPLAAGVDAAAVGVPCPSVGDRKRSKGSEREGRER